MCVKSKRWSLSASRVGGGWGLGSKVKCWIVALAERFRRIVARLGGRGELWSKAA